MKGQKCVSIKDGKFEKISPETVQTLLCHTKRNFAQIKQETPAKLLSCEKGFRCNV